MGAATDAGVTLSTQERENPEMNWFPRGCVFQPSLEKLEMWKRSCQGIPTRNHSIRCWWRNYGEIPHAEKELLRRGDMQKVQKTDSPPEFLGQRDETDHLAS